MVNRWSATTCLALLSFKKPSIIEKLSNTEKSPKSRLATDYISLFIRLPAIRPAYELELQGTAYIEKTNDFSYHKEAIMQCATRSRNYGGTKMTKRFAEGVEWEGRACRWQSTW